MADQIGDSDFALDPGPSRVFLHLMCIHCHASELKVMKINEPGQEDDGKWIVACPNAKCHNSIMLEALST